MLSVVDIRKLSNIGRLFTFMLLKFYLVHLAVQSKDADEAAKLFLAKLHPQGSRITIAADARELEHGAAEELEHEAELDTQDSPDDKGAEADEAFEEAITRNLLS